MARNKRIPFTLKSGNNTSFKAMGSSPMKIRFASPEDAASPAGQAMLASHQGNRAQPDAAAMEAMKKQAGQKMQEEGRRALMQHQMQGKMREEGRRAMQQNQLQMRGLVKGKQQAPFISMAQRIKEGKANKPNSVRMPVGASRPPARPNPAQAGQQLDFRGNPARPRVIRENERYSTGQPARPNRAQARPTRGVAVQSAPRPDLSGGPRQPMGGPGFGGPGQLPPNKGRRRPGMGRARRATGLARRARRAAGRVRRVRRSRR